MGINYLGGYVGCLGPKAEPPLFSFLSTNTLLLLHLLHWHAVSLLLCSKLYEIGLRDAICTHVLAPDKWRCPPTIFHSQWIGRIFARRMSKASFLIKLYDTYSRLYEYLRQEGIHLMEDSMKLLSMSTEISIGRRCKEPLFKALCVEIGCDCCLNMKNSVITN